MGIFAPPDLFAALALAARGDLDLPDGVHLRLMPSPVLGFPVAPFGVYRVTPFLATPTVLWRDRSGKFLTEPALEAAGGVLLADLASASTNGTAQDVAVELLTDGGFRGSIALLDRVGNRVFAERSRPPFIVGGPRVERVMIRGSGQVTGLRTWRVEMSRALEEMLNEPPLAILSLPIQGSRPWYANGQGRGASLDAVKRGAPLRLTRPDRPDGPFDPLTPTDDVARITALEAQSRLDQQCEHMVGDIAVFPGGQRLKRTSPATASRKTQIVDLSISNTLLVQAMDPGLGRYLGLVERLHEDTDGSRPTAYAAMGVFVYSPAALAVDGRSLGLALGDRPDLLQRLEAAFVDRVGAREVLSGVGRHYAMMATLKYERAFDARGLVAVAAAVPPPNPPSLAAPELGRSQWLKSDSGPSTNFQQELLFPAPPLGSLVALGRFHEGLWTTRHRTIELAAPADPRRRAVTMLLGRTQVKPRLFKMAKSLSSYMRRGLVSDAPVPAGALASSYRAALADLFGRFGPDVQFGVPSPPRPKPPTPALQAKVVLDGPQGVGGPAASPGHVDVSVVVPSVERLSAGSLEITALKMSFDGAARPPVAIGPIPINSSREETIRIDLPPLVVGETRVSSIAAAFSDSAGVDSDTVQISVKHGDRRQPIVIPTGLGLIWTSRPGPAPEVELKLTWPAAPDTRYRVYIADEKGLGLAGDSRADVAVQGGQRDRAHLLGGRERFRLLTEPPLGPAAGSIVLNETLPRSLATVQFVRVVPMTAQGREAEFDGCRVVPVAVPTDRRPPPPRLTAIVDPETRVATITIEGLGLDLVELKAAEPGLFTHPVAPDAIAPEFRLRRASGIVNDPAYAREIARGPLQAVEEGGAISFGGEVDDPTPLGSFIRYSYWAEVRMPPERRLARGVVEIPPPGGVAPVIHTQAADMVRPFSAPSAPATVLHIPKMPLPDLEGAAGSVIEEAGTLWAKLTATATPSASEKAIGNYRLHVWERWGDGPFGKATEIDLDGTALQWEGTPAGPADHPRPLLLRYMIIDPIGRESAVIIVPVT